MKKGRRTLLTPNLERRICALFRRGHTVATTVAAVGIGERTFQDWCKKRPAFFAATQRARAVGRVRIVQSILDADDWRARAWYLERCWPNEFARTADRQLPQEKPPGPEPPPPVVIYFTDNEDTRRAVAQFGPKPPDWQPEINQPPELVDEPPPTSVEGVNGEYS